MCSPAHVDLVERLLFVIGKRGDEAVELTAVVPREVRGFVRQNARPMPTDGVWRGAFSLEVGKVRPYWCIDLSGCSWRKRRWVWKEVQCLGLNLITYVDKRCAACALSLTLAEVDLILFHGCVCRLKHL